MKGENCISDGIRVLNAADIKAALPPRKAVSNKGDYGRAAIAAGCMRYGGAAVLAAQAALCGGAGYTALFVPEKLRLCLTGRVPEALAFSACRGGEWKLDGKRLRNILQYDAIAAGMGMGNTKSAAKVIAYLLKNYGGKLLLDADGLNLIAATYGVRGVAELFRSKKSAVLITPHPAEFARLTGKDMRELLKNDGELAVEEAKKYAARNCVAVLLKGASGAKTLICDGNRAVFNATGNSGQAKGGSGDTLSGLIVSIAASGASLFDAACAGAYLTGKAAEIAAKEVSEYALTATIISGNIGKAIREL